jgi:hypothetical protein
MRKTLIKILEAKMKWYSEHGYKFLALEVEQIIYKVRDDRN